MKGKGRKILIASTVIGGGVGSGTLLSYLISDREKEIENFQQKRSLTTSSLLSNEPSHEHRKQNGSDSLLISTHQRVTALTSSYGDNEQSSMSRVFQWVSNSVGMGSDSSRSMLSANDHFYSKESGAESIGSRLGYGKYKNENVSIATKPIRCRDGTKVFPWSAPTRDSQIKRLKEEKFDVLVIGGGAVGSGVALDAATRGLSVALVERDDFSSGTSGRSTKLIHGGVRYLENAFKHLDYSQYLLVKEALHERKHMLNAAPYMARALPIMVPLEHWWQVVYYRIGCLAYDLVAGKSGLPRSMFLSKEQALYSFPMLNASLISGAIVYYDGQMNDTRYSLAIALTAIQSGAVAANYLNVTKLNVNPETLTISGARVKDTLTGEELIIRARSVVNATGPFTDEIRHMAHDAVKRAKKKKEEEEIARIKNKNKDANDNSSMLTQSPPKDENNDTSDQEKSQDETNKERDDLEDLIIPAGGVHIVLPDHFSPANMGMIVPDTDDGRVLFFLPWEGGTLCGTTDSRTPITMLPSPSADEVDFILRESSKYLNRPIHRSDIRAAWSGIRPLAKDLSVRRSGETASISREHVVEVIDGGMVTIGGGKWTTYRKMAEDAVDALLEHHRKLRMRAGPCKTANLMLIGADRAGIICDQSFDIITITLREDYEFDRDIAEHLTRSYGTRALQIAELVKSGYLDRKANLHPRRIVPKYPFLEAEIVFAVEQEMACSAVDILARRTRLAYIDHDAAIKALPLVVDTMKRLLNWNKTRVKQELENGEKFLATMANPQATEVFE